MKQMAGIPHQAHSVDEDNPGMGPYDAPDDEEEDNFDMPDGATPTAPQASQTANNNQTGTIDGKPASYADAMAKFRDMVTGMGFDGSSPEAMQKSIQSKLGGMMKGMNIPGMGDNGQLDPQAMMKGIMSKMPQGQMPGDTGNIDPNAMMQQIMGKMPKQGMNMPGMNETDELASWLKIAGIK